MTRPRRRSEEPETPDAEGTCPVADPTLAHVSAELPHDQPLICCAFDPAGRFVFAGSEDFTVRRWDLIAGQAAAVPFVGHESWVFDLAPTPDGDTLLTAGGDGRVIFWDAGAHEPLPRLVLDAHDGWARGVAVSPDGTLAASCGNDRLVKVWSIEDGSLVHVLPGGHEKPAYCVGFHPGGDAVVSADLSGRVVEWDLASGEERRRLDASALYSYNGGQQVDYGGIRDLAFSAEGDRLACAGLVNASNPLGAVNDTAVLLFDWESGTEPAVQRGKGDLKGVAWGVRFHPGGFLAVASGGSGGGHLLFFRPGEAEEFHRLSLPNTARGLDLHPDGLRLATAHHDGKLRITRLEAAPA
ncbi:WD40 repeat domain-containing protein [Tautonia plasticadhaerens]|uniref:WD domain, G-beta repeat n=1 Tax=Tautonia plasticadhaerens TaxID=2527974 RepID=A0A518H5G0_9BACT|nr:WD40 repeat domain-containing protein [Tautonia plasticadhaerens]QDV36073.1 WD domain, G-beta repeat [Tautonia plasticadhaerens]